jgi:ferredoxin
MYSKILVLRFTQEEVNKPIVCRLAKRYNLDFNILNAIIYPRREGSMVLELSGTRQNFKEGVRYLKENGIDVKNASQEVMRDNEKCTHCGACTAVCTTGALSIERPEMTVVFDQQKCSVCELCIRACPTRAMTIIPSDSSVS